MRLPLNASHLAVLGWVADGCRPESIPLPTYKQSANTLHDRGLIELDRRRGRWGAELVDDGRYYLEHGSYPVDPNPPARTDLKTSGAVQSQPAGNAAAAPASSPQSTSHASPMPSPVPAASSEVVPVATDLRSPHPAVKVVIDNPGRLEAPKDLRRRALLLLHSIVHEAVRRGWKVEAVTKGSKDLVRIDAGHQPVGIRIKGPRKQVLHVKTDKEIADEKRYSYSWAPKYDYIPTDKLRVELRPGNYSGTQMEDSARTAVEQKLDRIFAMIQKESDLQQAREDVWRQRELERQRAQEIAVQRRTHGQAYGKWVTALDELQSAWQSFAATRQLLIDIRSERSTIDNESVRGRLAPLLAWAERHMEMIHPIPALRLPDGEPPADGFDDWVWLQRQKAPTDWAAFFGRR